MILQLLKQATRARHAALESRLTLLDPGLSREDYRLCIGGFFGYYAPLEAHVLDSPGLREIGLTYSERRKTPRLIDPIFLSYPVPKAVSPRFGFGAQANIRSTM